MYLGLECQAFSPVIARRGISEFSSTIFEKSTKDVISKRMRDASVETQKGALVSFRVQAIAILSNSGESFVDRFSENSRLWRKIRVYKRGKRRHGLPFVLKAVARVARRRFIRGARAMKTGAFSNVRFQRHDLAPGAEKYRRNGDGGRIGHSQVL